jgi:hypothetical protein
MNRKEYTVIRYDINKEFYVEITEKDELIEFYLCTESYGFKEHMFGLYKENCKPSEYWSYIASNVWDHIALYVERLRESE